MDHPTTQPAPAGALADSVRHTLRRLATLAEELDGEALVGPSLASRLNALAGELRDAANIIRAVPAKARP
jgi:hypothetical protein